MISSAHFKKHMNRLKIHKNIVAKKQLGLNNNNHINVNYNSYYNNTNINNKTLNEISANGLKDYNDLLDFQLKNIYGSYTKNSENKNKGTNAYNTYDNHNNPYDYENKNELRNKPDLGYYNSLDTLENFDPLSYFNDFTPMYYKNKKLLEKINIEKVRSCSVDMNTEKVEEIVEEKSIRRVCPKRKYNKVGKENYRNTNKKEETIKPYFTNNHFTKEIISNKYNKSTNSNLLEKEHTKQDQYRNNVQNILPVTTPLKSQRLNRKIINYNIDLKFKEDEEDIREQKELKPYKISKRGRKPITVNKFICQICGKRFSTPAAKGGHTSKAHPGQSIKYNQKLKIRKNRSYLRDRLFQIKVNYFRIYHNLDYETLYLTRKKYLKRLISNNIEEYRTYLRSVE